MNWQEGVALAIVALAVAYLLRGLFQDKGGDAGGCKGCPKR